MTTRKDGINLIRLSTVLYLIQVKMHNTMNNGLKVPKKKCVFQRVNEFVVAMEKTSYNIKAELPALVDHARKTLGSYESPPVCLSVHCFKIIFWNQIKCNGSVNGFIYCCCCCL